MYGYSKSCTVISKAGGSCSVYTVQVYNCICTIQSYSNDGNVHHPSEDIVHMCLSSMSYRKPQTLTEIFNI